MKKTVRNILIVTGSVLVAAAAAGAVVATVVIMKNKKEAAQKLEACANYLADKEEHLDDNEYTNNDVSVM